MVRNPNWTRDELILALDFYLRVSPIRITANPRQVSAQSQNFCNPTGVYMKLCNFLRLDPTYHGHGLRAGSKLDEDVWQEFHSAPDRLIRITRVIRNGYASLTPPHSQAQEAELTDDEPGFPEGQILWRLHRLRERSPALAKKKKREVHQKTGKLACEACDFNFAEFYGALGYGFIECHHDRPLAELRHQQKVKTSDLSLVCSNCHRILHRTRPWLTVLQLTNALEDRVRAKPDWSTPARIATNAT